MVSELLTRAGYRGDEPVVVGLRRPAQPPVFLAQGRTATGAPLTPGTVVYAASLSKQLTAACASLLAEDGGLDMESALSRWLPELPAWARDVRLRHLVHHTAGLPADADIDAAMASGRDRTTVAVLRALGRFRSPRRRPGTEQVYSNAGYVCLGVAVERAAGRPLPELARDRLFGPLAMADTRFWPGPGPLPAGAAPLVAGCPAPLSLGDGGVWSTAEDLMRWNHALNTDRLGISATLQTPGSLDDGTALDYAWGMGVRTHAGHRVYRHGGGWPGVRSVLARAPGLPAGLVVIALDDDTERAAGLADALLDEILPG
jgi:CubicO group peptidase (beta-lactamase class C family)